MIEFLHDLKELFPSINNQLAYVYIIMIKFYNQPVEA